MAFLASLADERLVSATHGAYIAIRAGLVRSVARETSFSTTALASGTFGANSVWLHEHSVARVKDLVLVRAAARRGAYGGGGQAGGGGGGGGKEEVAFW